MVIELCGLPIDSNSVPLPDQLVLLKIDITLSSYVILTKQKETFLLQYNTINYASILQCNIILYAFYNVQNACRVTYKK